MRLRSNDVLTGLDVNVRARPKTIVAGPLVGLSQ